MLGAPEPIGQQHRLDTFNSGQASLDEWLRHRALANQHSDSSRTFVIAEDQAVIGYYCLAAGALDRDAAPKPLQRNRPDPLPVMVLGRLAIDSRHQQKGIGTALLRDAMRRTVHATEHAGFTALLAHAISEDARRFYLSRGFLPSPLRPMTLCLPLATLRKGLDEIENTH
jgi:GNAT superfamily N-acetyltransferase